MALVYKITNLVNNKSYIGWTGKTLSERWEQHKNDALKNRDNRKFYNAIRKHGVDIWRTEILKDDLSLNEVREQEIKFIKLYNTYTEGYNATRGGDGNNGIIMSEESNRKRSIALKGVKKSKETIEKFKKRRSTPEENLKRSMSHKGMKKPWVKWTKIQIEKRAMTRRKITKEQFLEIHNLRKLGLTIKEIGLRVNLNNHMVKKWLGKNWEL